MMKYILVPLALVGAAALAQIEATPVLPNMILADENRTPIEGVSASTRVDKLQSKALELGDHDYIIIRPDGTLKVRGTGFDYGVIVEPPVDCSVTPDHPDCVVIDPCEDPTADGCPCPDSDAVYPNCPVASQDFGIVYSRVPRTQGPKESSYGYTMKHPDLWDALPEVGMLFNGFNAPGQLVFLHDGQEEIIYDCVGQASYCVPFDSSVSLDGTKIAFAVYRADNLKNPWPENKYIPVEILGSTNLEAQIYIYNIATKQTTAWPHLSGELETSPTWLPNGQIMFSSTRDGFWRPWLHQITPRGRVDPRLFIADADGSNAEDITPHEVASAIHPYVTSNGRVLYSSLWYSHNLAYIGTNGSVNWPTTLDNMWMVSDMDVEGGDMTAILGSHRNAIADGNGLTKNMKALHFIGERSNGDACVGNYYRSNNMGLGDVWCWKPEPKLLEGPAPSFLPRERYNVANWSRSNDEASKKINGIYQGKIGFPEGTADGQLLLTVGRGYCTVVALNPTNSPDLGDQKGCDAGIYKTTVIPSVVIEDIELVADSPLWHEFNARVVAPRSVANVPMERSGSDACILASSDAGSTDAHNKDPYNFNSQYRAMANNGGEIQGLSHDELAAIRFYEVIPNRTRYPDFKNSIGNEVKFMGDVPLLADKSFVAELPCETPYLMAGVDSDGRLIKRDQITMSLRTGEKRVCTGCHLHGEEGRAYDQSLAYTAEPYLIPESTPVPTFANDIEPILQSRCASCHADENIMDYTKLVFDPWQSSVPADRKTVVGTGSRQYALQRPQTSKYVNSMFARESLIYWKAANERTDGRADGQYSDDIDFGADHPTDITPQELKTLAAWLDSGAAR